MTRRVHPGCLSPAGRRDRTEPPGLFRGPDNFKDAAEAVIAAAIAGLERDAIRREQHRLSVAVEAAAAHHAITGRLALAAVLVLHPLVDIAAQIVDAERIGLKASDWRRILEAVVIVLERVVPKYSNEAFRD